MRLQKSTRYALYAAMEMASAPPGGVVTVGEVAGKYGMPAGALAKVFQQLVRSGIAVGTRGIGGGYRLAKPISEITVLDVLSAFEPQRPSGGCLLAESERDCHLSPMCRVRRLFDEVDESARNTLASITLATLVKH
ncbi:MAG TPA: Rrf2 family transcriptional regulator [Candidatus Polarisedimenticolia bacterium]|nr:Rrf2 family transcriptional regulator [Candidatus Polarisedimenticolia bacterium]